MTPTIVAAAIVEREGRLLITRRPRGVHLEGYWEFPGGKCDQGETVASCLARELREELDVDVLVGEEVFTTSHAYRDRSVELHFLECRLLSEPTPTLGQEMRWVTREMLRQLPFPPADEDLIRWLLRETV